MTADLLYRYVRETLTPFSEAASYEAKEILAKVLRLRETEIPMIPFLKKEVSEEAQKEIGTILLRRKTREPLEYILGFAWFYGLRFSVSPD